MQLQKIHFLFMGGTIDSHWDGKLDTAVTNSQSAIPDYFHRLVVYADISHDEICMKDSRELGEEDVNELVRAVQSAEVDRIIVTHGTYTMPDTARALKHQLGQLDKTVVFTGSMVPLLGFSAESSDASFNLGYAVCAVQNAPAGVYLAMNGRLFDPDEVAKNLKEGKYYSVFDLRQ